MKPWSMALYRSQLTLPESTRSMCRSRLQATVTAVVVFAFIGGCDSPPKADFVTSVPWGLVGRTLVLDSHAHSTFSDGALSVADLVNLAVTNGCDALALTDHSDPSAKTASPEYFAAVAEERVRVKDLLLFAGMEWNIPPYAQREHVAMLVDPALEQKLLPEFKSRFEDKSVKAEDALNWLAQGAGSRDAVALLYAHPSRGAADPAEKLGDFTRWQAAQGLFIGFEGGPGHQRLASPGDYQESHKTILRWDPVAAEIGGTWDRLLDAGHSTWAALAVSDYHNDQKDFAPCAFARTHLRVPQPDYRGVLVALRAGSFWADHGHILEDLAFIAVHPALPMPATPGETILLASSERPVFRVKVRRGVGSANLPVTVELIGNLRDGKPEKLATRELTADEDVFDWTPEAMVPGADAKSAYVRARVIANVSPDGPLAAYSNPIRIQFRR